MDARKSRLIILLGLGVFSILNTEMGFIGLLPYIAQDFNVTIVTAGLLISLFALGVAIAGPIMPLLASRFNRKYVMVVVLTVFTLANLLAMMTHDFTTLLLLRVIPAFLHPVYCALAFSVAAELAPKGEAPKAVARVNMGVAGGMVLGVPISNYLAGTFNLTVALGFFALATGLVLLLTIWKMPSLPALERPSLGGQVSVLKDLNVWLAIGFVICMNGSIFGVFNYMADYYSTVRMVTDQAISVLLLVFGLHNILGSYVAGNLLTTYPHHTLWGVLVGLLVFYGLFWMSPNSFWVLIVLAAVWGIMAGMVANIIQYHIVRAASHVPEFANGLFLTSANIGSVVGTSLGGVVIASWGMSWIISIGLILIVLAAFLAAAQHAYQVRTS